MTITRSQIIGKSINELDKSITDYLSLLTPTNTPHVVWSKLLTKAIDFLSSCTLRHSNSYGATYKIDPTSELTIIHTDGTRYPVDSYSKLLAMVITDYTEPTGATMPTKPQPGTHWERLKDLAYHSPKGEIIIVEQVTTNYISFSGSRNLTTKRAIKDNIKTSNPLLNLALVAGLGAVASYFINKQ